MNRARSALRTRLFDSEGSTRVAGLLRVLLALISVVEYGERSRAFELYANDLAIAPLIGPLFWASAFLMVVGLYSRLATALQALCQAVYYFGFGLALDLDGYFHHHTYTLMVSTALLAFAPCGASLSWDRLRALRRAERLGVAAPIERGPLWALSLIAVQVSCIYFWGAVDKSALSFLNGARLSHYALQYYFGSDLPGLWFEQLTGIGGTGVTVLEYILAFGLWSRRWLRLLVPAGLLLHAGMYVFLPVCTFSATMGALYLCYLDPDAVSRFIDRLLGSR